MIRIALALLVLTDVAIAKEQAEPPPVVRRPAPKPQQGPRADMDMPPDRPMPVRPKVVASPEVAKLGKQVAGTYKCKGVNLRGDGSSTPLEATVAIKLELDNAWVLATYAEKANAAKFDEYRTYDATAKQWTRIRMMSSSAHVIETSLGEKDGKWTWEGSEIASTGTTQLREFEQLSGKQIKAWGEAMLSGTWQKMYEATCKR